MQTVDQTEHLLDLWTSILSQAEHTQRLLDNPEWQGVNPVSASIMEFQVR